MLGAIAGDIIGSIYEWNPIKTTDFPLFSNANTFTDDTVLTCALADAILTNSPYADKLKEYYKAFPNYGYGGNFSIWATSDSNKPYNSCGNGSAMRVSPVGFAFNDLDTVLEEAKKSAEVTHNHPEGIKGAQATASAIYQARNGESKNEIKSYIEDNFYDLAFTLDEIRPTYEFNELCQTTVPQAIKAFLESTDFEHAIRLAVSLGGDSDTLACITGGIAEAFYGEVPGFIRKKVFENPDERLAGIVIKFYNTYLHSALLL